MHSFGFIIKLMLKTLTFPGSSLERGTLRKHLFNDRLCRIEFCGGKTEREKGGEVSEHISKIRSQTSVQYFSVANITASGNKGIQLVGMYHFSSVTATAPVIKVSSFQWHEIWPTTVSTSHSTQVLDLCTKPPGSNTFHQCPTNCILVAQIYRIPRVPKIGARRNPTLGWLLIPGPDIN